MSSAVIFIAEKGFISMVIIMNMAINAAARAEIFRDSLAIVNFKSLFKMMNIIIFPIFLVTVLVRFAGISILSKDFFILLIEPLICHILFAKMAFFDMSCN